MCDTMGHVLTLDEGLLSLVPTTGSTNDDVRALATQGASHGTAVASLEQTAGRGRRGHVWRSPEGGLYLSILLRPPVPMHMFMGIPVLASLACVKALRALASCDEIAVKWPNDIVAGNRKVGGVLVEAGSSEQGAYAVVGIGINVEKPALQSAASAVPGAPECAEQAGQNAPEPLPSARPLDPVYLCELTEAEPDFAQLASALRASVVEACDDWTAQVKAGRALAGPLAPILSEYFDMCSMLGHQVVALAPEGTEVCRGSFSAVDVWGRATVHTSDGRDVELSPEQASLRLA